MSWCHTCGEPIEFRYIDGKCIPFHKYGSCGGIKASAVTGYSRNQNSDTCIHTRCPVCGDKVFFIRHNGGSVWLDSPLGPPWFKHPCFDSQDSSTPKESLASHYKIEIEGSAPLDRSNLILGLVGPNCRSEYNTNPFQSFKTIQFYPATTDQVQELKIKHCAEVILCQLCIYDKSNGLIWPVSELTHKLAVLEEPIIQ